MQTLTVIGRDIGTYEDWDGVDESTIVFYQFKPTSDIALPVGDLTVEYEHGWFKYHYRESGEEMHRFDIIETIGKLARIT